MPKNPMDLIFGDKPKGYKSKNVRDYENSSYQGIANRAGATMGEDGKYDFSNSFKPITGAQGVQKATAGYDYAPTDQAIQGYRSPTRFKFQGLPQQYSKMAYESRAGDVRREGAGQLEKLREDVGVRRPDMLAKLGQDSQRNTNRSLAQLNSELALNEMNRNTDLAVDEQKANADERFRNLGALSDTGLQKINSQASQVTNERAYEDQALQWLQNMFQQGTNTNNQAAQIDAQNRAATMQMIGQIAGSFNPMSKAKLPG